MCGDDATLAVKCFGARPVAPQSARFLPRPFGKMIFDALVLNASLRQALVTVRSLGRRGLRVAAAAHLTSAPAFSSRWCLDGFLFPPDEATAAYLATLEQWLNGSGVGTIIPLHDGTIALLRQHRGRLEQRARLALADERALAVAVNKEMTLAVANRLGVRVPREAVVLEDALGERSDCRAE